ncbi:MAG: hypothetical protein ACMUHB_00315, partial [Thermoplasmatota archaeon]
NPCSVLKSECVDMVSVSGSRAVAPLVVIAFLMILLSACPFSASTGDVPQRSFRVEILHEIPMEGTVEPGIYLFQAGMEGPEAGDPAFRWSFDGLEVSRGSELEAYLSPGNHSIMLEAVFEGNVSEETLNVTVSLSSETGSGSIPLLWISVGIAAMVAASLLTFFLYVLFDMVRSSGVMTAKDDDHAGIQMEKIDHGRSCDICLKPFTGDTRTIECQCGSSFHPPCGRREGVCPECGREIMI